MIRWVSYQTMLGVMIQAPFAIGTFHFYFCWHPFKTELKSEMAYIVFLNMIKSPDLSPGMSLITVMAIFIPNWSNLQLIGSAVTFIQVGIFRFWGGPCWFGWLLGGCWGSLLCCLGQGTSWSMEILG